MNAGVLTLQPKKMSKARAGTIDPALHGSHCRTCDLRNLFVAHAINTNQDDGFALIPRQLRQSSGHILYFQSINLLRQGYPASGMAAVSVFHFPLVSTAVREELIAHDREQPCLKVGIWLEIAPLVPCSRDGLLHQIVGLVSVACSCKCHAPQMRNELHQRRLKGWARDFMAGVDRPLQTLNQLNQILGKLVTYNIIKTTQVLAEVIPNRFCKCPIPTSKR
jgi:hypothetical protein